MEALHNLKKDNNHVVLSADKGVVLVVMDKDTYIKKCSGHGQRHIH